MVSTAWSIIVPTNPTIGLLFTDSEAGVPVIFNPRTAEILDVTGEHVPRLEVGLRLAVALGVEFVSLPQMSKFDLVEDAVFTTAQAQLMTILAYPSKLRY